MILGGYIFSWDPANMTLIESRKTVASVPTYNGGAIFQWAAIWQGQRVVLSWDIMEEEQYKRLRYMYLQTNQYLFNPQTDGSTFNVIVVGLSGRYIDTVMHDQPYRMNVRLELEIRSVQNEITLTSTTTTTTTTTA